jgi:LuxR family maltose regulon positive regulatory protein
LRVSVYVLLVRLHHALGSVDVAQRYLQRIVHVSLTPGLVLLDTPLATQIAEQRLLLSRSRPDLHDLFVQAVEWAEESGLRPDDAFRYEQEYDCLTLARVRIAQGRAEEVIPLLDRLIAAAEGAGQDGQLISYLALQAAAHRACGRTHAALAALSRALALGEPEGYMRTFLDLGPPMHDLLRDAARQSLVPHKAYVSELVGAFGPDDARADTDAAICPQPVTLVEPLNDRELQILRLLAAGLSDREIAKELYLSINTVKWYNRQIYGKLGVRRRDPAVARALELGILRDA